MARRRPREHDGETPAELAIFEAIERLLDQQPLHHLTVAHIIEAAGLSRASFYHYFASKYDVVVALLTRIFDEAYASPAWREPAGEERARSMGSAIRSTMQTWSGHGAVIRAAVENMHAVPEMAAAWQAMRGRFVGSIADQITHERNRGAAPAGAPAEMIATVLVCGAERAFYVGSLGLDPRLPGAPHAVAAIGAMTTAAIYGSAQLQAPPRDRAWTLTRPGTPATAETDSTEAAILRATSRLLQDHALDDLSVARILTAAKVSRATFYFYFSSRDDAFVALLDGVAADLVPRFQEILEDADLAGNRNVADRMCTAWGNLEPGARSVVQNAIREWPRRPEVRRLYLDGIGRLTTALAARIDADRETGVAPGGVDSAELAATLLWTIERTLAGSAAHEAHLDDTAGAIDLLGRLVVTSIYGR